MRGTSQTSRAAVLQGFDPVISAAGKDGLTIAQQLFAVVDSIDSSGSLRRALTDPARPGADKTSLIDELFGSADSRVKDVLAQFVGRRWSAEADLVESIEHAGVAALLAYAESSKQLETVEEELFAVERLLVAERDLLTAIGNRSTTPQVRLALLKQVIGDKVSEISYALLARLVGTPRGHRVLPAIRRIIDDAAARRSRSVARVTAAVELSAAQRKRLTGILEGAYGRSIQINVSIDPAVLGGMRVQVGDEIVDATVLTRLDEARRRLVS